MPGLEPKDLDLVPTRGACVALAALLAVLLLGVVKAGELVFWAARWLIGG